MVLMWRAWVVWNRRWWVVIIPCLAIGVHGGFGYYSTWGVAQLNPFKTFPTASFVSIILSNGTSTLLISGRIWFYQRQLSKSLGKRDGYASKSSINIATLLVESGALYNAFNIACLLTSKTPAQQIMLAGHRNYASRDYGPGATGNGSNCPRHNPIHRYGQNSGCVRKPQSKYWLYQPSEQHQ
ncbi:hypothetical protein BDZ97DRAFT_2064332 [Flammula alnicola]|nr:hypothetical protein BDZ97DRAFT_2064332 [Flammula alnicola]